MYIQGNYNLNIWIGDVLLPVTPQMIEELTITQDIDRLLPTFKMVLADSTRQLGDILPYDKRANQITIEFSRTSNLSNVNRMKFLVKRRVNLYPDDRYEISGVLDVPAIITDRQSRSFPGNIKSNLETIALEDLAITNTEIGASLNYDKTFLQPLWTDAKMFQYLKDNLIGKNNEAGYYCFIRNKQGQQTLVFKSLNELLLGPVKYNFIVGHKSYLDQIPIVSFQIYDNSQLISDLGAKTQDYIYFNYEKGTEVTETIELTECPTLSEFILVDDDKNMDTPLYTNTGRSNAFTSDFKGRVKNDYFRRITEFVNMWAATWGLENISPGDVVQVVFADALSRGDLFVYQHSGTYLVRRVVHIIGSSFMTNLLLVRAGITTDIDTTLVESENRIRK